MVTNPDKRSEIMNAAEIRARRGGYYGFSFRDIANDVGIKSASVHYHFPTKEALVEALGERYLERAQTVLGSARDHTEEEAIEKVIGLFTHSSEEDDLMCLCGMFGAEVAALPETVGVSIASYFDFLVTWLADAIQGGDASERARVIVAALEGGLIISRAKKDPSILRQIGAQFVRR